MIALKAPTQPYVATTEEETAMPRQVSDPVLRELERIEGEVRAMEAKLAQIEREAYRELGEIAEWLRDSR